MLVKLILGLRGPLTRRVPSRLVEACSSTGSGMSSTSLVVVEIQAVAAAVGSVVKIITAGEV